MSDEKKHNCSEKVAELANGEDKIDSRKLYNSAKGFNVTVRVTYERTRRVRALDEDQAKAFAAAREAKFSPSYFHGQNIGYVVMDIESVDADPVADSEEEVIE